MGLFCYERHQSFYLLNPLDTVDSPILFTFLSFQWWSQLLAETQSTFQVEFCLHATPSTTFPVFAQKRKHRAIPSSQGPPLVLTGDMPSMQQMCLLMLTAWYMSFSGCSWDVFDIRVINWQNVSMISPSSLPYGEKQDIWRHGHSFLSWFGKEDI